jgi:hypothetical protein
MVLLHEVRGVDASLLLRLRLLLLQVVDFCKSKGIGLVLVGPEAPLVAGLVDDLTAAGIRTFGPSAAAAQLEGSKKFMKVSHEHHAMDMNDGVGLAMNMHLSRAESTAAGIRTHWSLFVQQHSCRAARSSWG